MDPASSASTFAVACPPAGLAGNGPATPRKPLATAEALSAWPGRSPRRCKTRIVVGSRSENLSVVNWKRDASFLAGDTRIWMADRYHFPSREGFCFPIKAFTERQETLVKESWEILRKDAGKHALDFFLRVFEIAPSTKRLFSFLRDSDLPLEKNPKLKSHSLKVFVITCEAATSLRNEGIVSTPGSTLKNMADAHALAGVVDEHYDVVKFALLKTIEEGLPAEKWSQEVKEAWAEAYDELVKAIKAETGTQASVQ